MAFEAERSPYRADLCDGIWDGKVIMSYSMTIVCLADSRKCSGRCIAGKEVTQGHIGDWVRPVSARETHEISEEERRYQDGTYPHLLDIIAIRMKQAMPEAHQNENHLIDPQYYWEKTGAFRWSDMAELVDSPSELWGTGDSSYSGLNNRLPVHQPSAGSLYLIHPDKVTLKVGRKAPEFPDSKRAICAQFRYKGVQYLIDVTDPYVESKYLRQEDGRYSVDSPYVCVSLGEEYNGYCYKFVASILTQEWNR